MVKMGCGRDARKMMMMMMAGGHDARKTIHGRKRSAVQSVQFKMAWLVGGVSPQFFAAPAKIVHVALAGVHPVPEALAAQHRVYLPLSPPQALSSPTHLPQAFAGDFLMQMPVLFAEGEVELSALLAAANNMLAAMNRNSISGIYTFAVANVDSLVCDLAT